MIHRPVLNPTVSYVFILVESHHTLAHLEPDTVTSHNLYSGCFWDRPNKNYSKDINAFVTDS